jgi:hypothetical protein
VGFLDRLFKRGAAPIPHDHAVIVHFTYGSTDLAALFALENRLEAAIAKAGAGEFDGNEIATDGSDGFLYMYGPDADRLFAAIKPCLEETPFTRGAEVQLRYGPAGSDARESTVVIATWR